jgi:hypothetical protein
MDFKKYVNAYEFETVLPGNGKTITFKPITTGQIKRLLLYETSNDADSIEKSLDNVITECVIDEGFNIDELYLQDRFYLLLDLRKATKGNTYSFQSKCSKCDSQSAQNINLSKLTVKKLEMPLAKKIVKPIAKKGVKPVEEIIPEEITEDWNIVKLNDNLKIRLSHITRGVQKAIRKYLEENKTLTDQQKEIEEATLLYSFAIISVITPEGEEGDLTIDDKIYLVDNIPQGEVDLISKWFESHDFGVDFSFEVICAHCQNVEKKVIPLDNFFF